MSETLLPAVIIEPEQADYAVIWLHGLGANGYDFEPIVEELDFGAKQRTRFIFPHAPNKPITINGGYVMPAWYDIIAIAAGAREDEAGIRSSEMEILKLLDRQMQAGIPAERIVLAGFSQGGAIALHTGLRCRHKLAGILALSTYLPLMASLPGELNSANQEADIMMMHGQYDPVVPLELAQLSKQRMYECGLSPNWLTYPMDHSVCPQQIDDISRWFGKVLP